MAELTGLTITQAREGLARGDFSAVELARELGDGATVVTVLCDTGMKYLSNPAFQGRLGETDV